MVSLLSWSYHFLVCGMKIRDGLIAEGPDFGGSLGLFYGFGLDHNRAAPPFHGFQNSLSYGRVKGDEKDEEILRAQLVSDKK